MSPVFKSLYEDISAGRESLDLLYVPSWNFFDPEKQGGFEWVEGISDFDSKNINKEMLIESMKDALCKQRSLERARGKAVIGPQSDKIFFLVDGKNAMHYSSQGQQRSIVLAFKLAESSVIQATLNQKPVLLLDDVLSELDEMRRRYFLDFISDEIQTFITTTDAECFGNEIMSKAHIVDLSRESEI